MASEPKRIWLSMDADAFTIWAWNTQPTAKGSYWEGTSDAVRCLSVATCLEDYGVAPEPGQCIPIDLVPGEPIQAEEQTHAVATDV